MDQFSKVNPDAARYARHPEPSIDVLLPSNFHVDGYVLKRLSNEIPICNEQVRLIWGDMALQWMKGSKCVQRGEPGAVLRVEGGETPALVCRLVLGFESICGLRDELFGEECAHPQA